MKGGDDFGSIGPKVFLLLGGGVAEVGEATDVLYKGFIAGPARPLYSEFQLELLKVGEVCAFNSDCGGEVWGFGVWGFRVASCVIGMQDATALL